LQRQDPQRRPALPAVEAEEHVPGVSRDLHHGRDHDPADSSLSEAGQKDGDRREVQGEVHRPAVQRGEHELELIGQAHDERAALPSGW
jgi:hypothetical protein